AHMSHELRNPLNAIIGYAEMLVERAEELGDDEFEEDSRRILKVARMQLSIIGDSLDLAKIEAGHMSFERTRFRVVELMREVVTAARPLVQRNANLFEVSLGRSLGEAIGDPVRIRQILLNLLGNAAKFTHEGRVTLTVRRTRDDGDAPTLSFRVQDTGIGMEPEEVERLFSPFFQARGGAGGTGLGLAISQQLARSMGGDITVTSRVGAGSSFSLYLPVESPEQVDEDAGRRSS
ncbi:MAG: hybrid sensor histidine kinase/response regulator, partial [Myxococcales bacterium]|nr:hybrid sensor histidine kinase/response regulator [Myxococcales bacterium]